ncbi:hypothetical protein CF386_10830 [Paraphotobacterium marinum]|uniref:Uncharacterized protein n=1 Tax=Paraphotobacterium marinum TaxID=1755811 RepID=A0A220VHV3_9GAMM|nr:hypothetical protein [Paraphotobacterium marinum]ASK79543.1 hypothetical protein CF386_10830 [Paraphotobacterium marinum]
MKLKQRTFGHSIFLLLLASTIVYGFLFKNKLDMPALISNDSVQSVIVNNQQFKDTDDMISNQLGYPQLGNQFYNLKSHDFSTINSIEDGDGKDNLSVKKNKLFFEEDDSFLVPDQKLNFDLYNSNNFEHYYLNLWEGDKNTILFSDTNGYYQSSYHQLPFFQQINDEARKSFYGHQVSINFPETEDTPYINLDYYWKNRENNTLFLNFNYDLYDSDD